MALDTSLNEHQLEVLRWISDGCPDGRWTDFSFKTTATALASRRLVTVSKRGGLWSAAILPAGEYYLTDQSYPPDHWAKRRRSPSVDLDRPARPASVAKRPVAPLSEGDASRTKKPVPPAELTPTRKLVKEIVDAGGMLEIDTKDDETSYRSLVGIINRRGMATDGQEVLMARGRSYHHAVFRLSAVSDWQTEPATDVVLAERIGRWHPAVAKLRDEKRFDSIAKELRGRAFRLLHALSREAEARGHSVRVPGRDRHGYRQDSSGLYGDLLFKVDEIECSVSISQPKDRVDHVPIRHEIERERKYGWGPHRYDYVPSNRLSIAIDTSSRFSSKQSWTDTRTIPLQLRLPDVMMTFERWAVINAESVAAERREALKKQHRRERQDELAQENYTQKALADMLIADLQSWELAGRLRDFLGAMERQMAAMDRSEERAAAIEWHRWCEQYVDSQDPLMRPIKMPAVKPPDFSQLQEARRRLGFRDSW